MEYFLQRALSTSTCVHDLKWYFVCFLGKYLKHFYSSSTEFVYFYKLACFLFLNDELVCPCELAVLSHDFHCVCDLHSSSGVNPVKVIHLLVKRI